MPRKKSLLKQTLDMNYGDIIKDFYGNEPLLRKALRELSKQANRQINELKKDVLGEYSPALESLRKKGTNKKFKIKAIDTMDYNQVVSEFWKARNFLKAETSSLEGWMNYRKSVKERIGGDYKGQFYNRPRTKSGAKRTIDLEKKYWRIYNKLVDEYGAIITEQLSDVVQKKLWQVMANKDMSQRDSDLIKVMRAFIEQSNNNPNFNEEQFDANMKLFYGKDAVRSRMGKY